MGLFTTVSISLMATFSEASGPPSCKAKAQSIGFGIPPETHELGSRICNQRENAERLKKALKSGVCFAVLPGLNVENDLVSLFSPPDTTQPIIKILRKTLAEMGTPDTPRSGNKKRRRQKRILVVDLDHHHFAKDYNKDKKLDDNDLAELLVSRMKTQKQEFGCKKFVMMGKSLGGTVLHRLSRLSEEKKPTSRDKKNQEFLKRNIALALSDSQSTLGSYMASVVLCGDPEHEDQALCRKWNNQCNKQSRTAAMARLAGRFFLGNKTLNYLSYSGKDKSGYQQANSLFPLGYVSRSGEPRPGFLKNLDQRVRKCFPHESDGAALLKGHTPGPEARGTGRRHLAHICGLDHFGYVKKNNAKKWQDCNKGSAWYLLNLVTHAIDQDHRTPSKVKDNYGTN